MPINRITLITSSLAMGGAEKNIALLAGEMAKRGKTVTVISFDRHPPFFQLDPAVTLVKTDITRGYRNLISDVLTTPHRLFNLRRVIQETKPDLVVSFMAVNNLLTLLATRGLNLPVIVAERSDPRIWPTQSGWRVLRAMLYPGATRIITQTEGAKAFFPKTLQDKVTVIGNPLLPFALRSRLPEKLHEKRVLSTARLVAMKRFDILLQAMATLHKEFPDWSLDILGDGEERGRLEVLRDRLGLAGAVQFHGAVNETGPFLQKASLFVLCSDFEGFPNALAEAMAAGLPVISTDTQGGRELIQNNQNGLLIPIQNQAHLETALRQLMGNAALREKMSLETLKQTHRYSLERILGKWEDAFASI